MSKKKNFGTGIFLGAIIAGITTYFLSPRSGKENRECVKNRISEIKKFIDEKEIDQKIKEIFGDLSDDSKKYYAFIKDEISKKYDKLKETLDEKEIDEIILEIISDLKKKYNASAKTVERVKKFLLFLLEEKKQVFKEKKFKKKVRYELESSKEKSSQEDE